MTLCECLLFLWFLFMSGEEVVAMDNAPRIMQGFKVVPDTTTAQSPLSQIKGFYIKKKRTLKPSTAVQDLYRFMGSLQYKGTHICGSSIISPYWILTAAHCCFNKNKTMLQNRDLAVGVGNAKILEQRQRKIGAKVCHARYDQVWAINDVAVFQVLQPFIFDNNIQPIKLYSGRIDDEHHNITGMVLGWGYTSNGSELVKNSSDTLQYVAMHTVSPKTCSGFVKNLKDSQLCAFNDDGMKGTCKGDSGGPLVVEIDDELVQIGIISFGAGNCNNTKPEVYTRISSFNAWIKKYTKQLIIDIFA